MLQPLVMMGRWWYKLSVLVLVLVLVLVVVRRMSRWTGTALTHTLSPMIYNPPLVEAVDSRCDYQWTGPVKQILLDRIQTLIDSAQVDDFIRMDFEAMKVEIDEKIESMGTKHSDENVKPWHAFCWR